MSDDRPIVYNEGDEVDGDLWVFRASSVGRSTRCLVAAMKGQATLPAPDYLMKAAEAGNRAEVVVKDKLRGEGYVIGAEQGSVELEIAPRVIIRGHMDAGAIMKPDGDDVFMLEVKSMSRGVWEKWHRWGWERFGTYKWQLAAYMHATGLPALYAIINRETDEMVVTTMMTPPVGLDEITEHVVGAVNAYKEGGLPHCDVKPEYQCPYEYLCDLVDPLFEELEGGGAMAIDHVANEYETVRETIKALEDRKEVLKEELGIVLAGRERVETDRWRVTVVKSTRRLLDAKALREELGERLNQFYKESKYEYPKLTKKKGST